jgi:hypothetical protein
MRPQPVGVALSVLALNTASRLLVGWHRIRPPVDGDGEQFILGAGGRRCSRQPVQSNRRYGHRAPELQIWWAGGRSLLIPRNLSADLTPGIARGFFELRDLGDSPRFRRTCEGRCSPPPAERFITTLISGGFLDNCRRLQCWPVSCGRNLDQNQDQHDARSPTCARSSSSYAQSPPLSGQ